MAWARWALPLSVLLVTLLAAPAQAALFLVFQTDGYQPAGYEIAQTGGIGSPGDVVRAHTGGSGALGEIQVVPVFLAADDVPSRVSSSDDLKSLEGVIPIGDLRSDARGTGHLKFETPNMAAGDYMLVGYCTPCEPFSAGSNVIPLAPFRVTAGTSSPSAPAGVAVAGVIGVLVLLGGALMFLRSRSQREKASAASI
jgi:hypothetical protein